MAWENTLRLVLNQTLILKLDETEELCPSYSAKKLNWMKLWQKDTEDYPIGTIGSYKIKTAQSQYHILLFLFTDIH